MEITIVNKLNGGVQAWTFDIEENDLNKLMEKYDGRGASVLSDADDIGEEIKTLYREDD